MWYLEPVFGLSSTFGILQPTISSFSSVRKIVGCRIPQSVVGFGYVPIGFGHALDKDELTI